MGALAEKEDATNSKLQDESSLSNRHSGGTHVTGEWAHVSTTRFLASILEICLRRLAMVPFASLSLHGERGEAHTGTDTQLL